MSCAKYSASLDQGQQTNTELPYSQEFNNVSENGYLLEQTDAEHIDYRELSEMSKIIAFYWEVDKNVLGAALVNMLDDHNCMSENPTVVNYKTPHYVRITLLGRMPCRINMGFDTRQEELEFLITTVIEKMSPDIALVSSSLNERHFELFENIGIPMKKVPASSFDFSKALRRIKSIIARENSEVDGGLRIGGILDKENSASIKACGAVIQLAQGHKLIQRNTSVTFDMYNMGDFLYINYNSLNALDIVREQSHPSFIRNNAGTKKEGFSLLTLLDRVKSTIGRKLLREWVTCPLANKDIIEERLSSVEILMKIRIGKDSCRELYATLKQIKDVDLCLRRIRKCKGSIQDWTVLAKSIVAMDLTLETAKYIFATQNVSNLIDFQHSMLHEIVNSRSSEYMQVREAFEVIDWEISKENDRLIPQRGVSKTLDEYRDMYEELDDLLAEVKEQCEALYGPTKTKEMIPNYIPSVGFVIMVKILQNSTFNPPKEFECVFQQDADGNNPHEGVYVFYKSPITKSLDKQCGDIFGLIVNLESKVFRDLENSLLVYQDEIYRVCQRCAELDILLSFASIALDFDYVRPTLRNDGILDLKEARHPLLEHSCENDVYIPNDITLRNGDLHSIMLLSGPNMSGKTLILKTIGTIVIMAQIGSFVPCKEAIIGIVDKIFTRIESIESATEIFSSAFTADVQQVSRMLHYSTRNSLLLMDEWGKGTNSFDGASLCASTLDNFAMRKTECPRICCTSHFSEIMPKKYFSFPQAIQEWNMEVTFGSEDADSDDLAAVPIPLFKLRLGAAKKSYGIACAVVAKVDVDLVNRAKEVLLLLKEGTIPECNFENSLPPSVLQCIAQTDWKSASERDILQFLSGVHK